MLCTSVCLKLRLFVFAYDCYWNEDNSHSAQHLHTHVLIGSYFKKLGAFRFRRCVESSIDIINVENHAFSHKVIVFIWNSRYTIHSHDYRSMHRCQGGRIYARLHGIRDAQWMQRHHQPNIYTEHIVFHAKCNQIAPHNCVHICYLSSVLFIVIVARLIVWVPANIFWGGWELDGYPVPFIFRRWIFGCAATILRTLFFNSKLLTHDSKRLYNNWMGLVWLSDNEWKKICITN